MAEDNKRLTSIADLENAKEEAVKAHGKTVTARRKLEEINKAFEKIKKDPVIVAKLAIIDALEEEKSQKSREAQIWEDKDDIHQKYDEIIAALKQNPEDSILAGILCRIVIAALGSAPATK